MKLHILIIIIFLVPSSLAFGESCVAKPEKYECHLKRGFYPEKDCDSSSLFTECREKLKVCTRQTEPNCEWVGKLPKGDCGTRIDDAIPPTSISCKNIVGAKDSNNRKINGAYITMEVDLSCSARCFELGQEP
ncbi:MAG: hypothetical protein KDD70_16275 [Bdellovibrionales bacterium]|nr:hypothetical protein [Bdellovibrionales bacterium]